VNAGSPAPKSPAQRIARRANAALSCLLLAAAPLSAQTPSPAPKREPVPALVASPETGAKTLAAHDVALERGRRSLVRVIAMHAAVQSAGRGVAQVASGVVIDTQGHVLTTAGAVSGAVAVRVRTPNGRDVDAEIVGVDPATDLALVRIPSGLVEPIALAPASAVAVGATVLTVARSYGALPTQDVGRITWRYDEPMRSLIQMSNGIYPGNPGGAVLDPRGRLVGVLIGGLGEVQAAAEVVREAGGRGPSFAIPIDDLAMLIDDLRRYGEVRRGFLGISIRQGLIEDPVRPGDPARLGVEVSDVVPGGPAWQAGVRAGDLVIAAEGKPLNSPDELIRHIAGLRPGSTTELLWLRGDVEHRARLSLASTPDSIVAANGQGGRARATDPRRREQIEAEMLRLQLELDQLERSEAGAPPR
jgi:S1-C subfamily serine protease